MSIEEARYWKSYIDRVMSSKLTELSDVQWDAAAIRTFSDRYMQTITGQQALPQSVFRQFVDLFARIPEQQVTLNEVVEWLEANLPFEECTDEEIYAMFDLWDGYISLSSMVVDNQGWINVDTLELNDDDFIKVKEGNIENDYLTR